MDDITGLRKELASLRREVKESLSEKDKQLEVLTERVKVLTKAMSERSSKEKANHLAFMKLGTKVEAIRRGGSHLTGQISGIEHRITNIENDIRRFFRK